MAVNNSLTSNGTSALNNTTLSGSLNGLSVVSSGSDVVLTYNASTMTFTVILNNSSIINTKLQYSYINLFGLQMNLGGIYTVPNLYITNAMLAKSSITLNTIPMVLGSSYTLTTNDIQESVLPTNKYYTDARARASISGTAPIIYNNTTGVISLNTTIAQTQTFTAQTTFNNGNNVQGTTYSVFFIREGKARKTRLQI